MKTCYALFCSTVLFGIASGARGADVTMVKDGQAQVAIHVDAVVMAADTNARSPSGNFTAAETERRQLRGAVEDLALYLGNFPQRNFRRYYSRGSP